MPVSAVQLAQPSSTVRDGCGMLMLGTDRDPGFVSAHVGDRRHQRSAVRSGCAGDPRAEQDDSGNLLRLTVTATATARRQRRRRTRPRNDSTPIWLGIQAFSRAHLAQRPAEDSTAVDGEISYGKAAGGFLPISGHLPIRCRWSLETGRYGELGIAGAANQPAASPRPARMWNRACRRMELAAVAAGRRGARGLAPSVCPPSRFGPCISTADGLAALL